MVNKVYIILISTVAFGSCASDQDKVKQMEEELKAQRMENLRLKEKEVREKNKVGVIDENNRSVDYRSTIRSFFEAEKNRDMSEILSFYADEIKRYYDFNKPSLDQLKKEYRASWDRSSYAVNENPRFIKIDEYTYDVTVDYRFYQNTRGEEKIVKSTLRFVFDVEGKIREVYSL